MLIEIVRDSTRETRSACFEGYCGPGARVMLTIPTVVVRSSPRSRAMSPIVEFNLNTGRGVAELADWALVEDSWRRLVEGRPSGVKCSPRYRASARKLPKPPKPPPVYERQLELW